MTDNRRVGRNVAAREKFKKKREGNISCSRLRENNSLDGETDEKPGKNASRK